MRNLKFVFAGIGTKGDVLPLLALAEELQRRGHACDVLANDVFAEQAHNRGLGFLGVTTEQKNNLVDHDANLDGHIMPSYEPTKHYFREQVRHGMNLIVINLDEFSASNAMCELYGLTLCRVHLAPTRIRSLIAPPWPGPRMLAGPLGSMFRKFTLPRLYSQMAKSESFLTRCNPHRNTMGLHSIESTVEIDRHIRLRLCMFPDWFCSPAPDWPRPARLVGFPLPPSTSVLPEEIRSFIERFGKPIVFTPGTGVQDVDAFFRDAKACCDALGRPGLFLSPCLPTGAQFGPNVLAWSYVDLERLLPLAAMLVHHGGIGTTARALRAGVPQLVLPVAYDQPDNGYRVRTLGVGEMLEAAEYSSEGFVEMARRLLESPEVARCAREYRDRTSQQNGVVAGADVLEELSQQVRSGTMPSHDSSRLFASTSPLSDSSPAA